MSNIDGNIIRAIIQGLLSRVQLYQTRKMRPLRSRPQSSSSSDLKRKIKQATTTVCEAQQKSSPAIDDHPNCKGIDGGNQLHMSITLKRYRSLSKTFEAATGRLHEPKQLKNKYNLLKSEWHAWSKLMDCQKGPTGIGFDQVIGLFNASADWWAKMDKIDKECCKFITKTLEHSNLMECVFIGAAAMGKNAWTPGETCNPMELEGESDSPEFSSNSNELGASEMASMMNSANINAIGSRSKRKHSSAKTLQNKCITGAAALATSIDDLVNFLHYGQAVEWLYEIQGLDPADQLLHFGVMLMEVLNNQEMVMSIPTDQGIIGWLQAKKQDKERSGGMNNEDCGCFRGYNNKKGFLAPYKGNRYHQLEFQRHNPRNRDELFNCVHSSLLSVIERTFGAWKAQWRFLKDMPRFDFRKAQVPLVAASMALHNFIHRNSRNDEIVAAVTSVAEYSYANMDDQDDLAALDDVMIPRNDNIEMVQLRARIRVELVAIWRNAR
ncbi:unnamed protein product [Camellia sinensis]